MSRQGLSRLEISKTTKLAYRTVCAWLDKEGIAPTGQTKAIGDIGEAWVANKLQELGLTAQVMPQRHPFDILCGELRIEVKTAAKAEIKPGGSRVAYFNTRPIRHSLLGHWYPKSYKEDSDFVVFLWLGDAESPRSVWVKASQDCPAMTGITLNPKYKRAGGWGDAKDAWHLIHAAYESGRAS
ncbi:hypothetical protein WDJ50_02775 [Deinococcus sp. VB142]|uniref:Endonuclease n=1 Tax=Deinococcus sp. VB142 TaxID=3112952 RepID=A0AAU6Q364_9DEIO